VVIVILTLGAAAFAMHEAALLVRVNTHA